MTKLLPFALLVLLALPLAYAMSTASFSTGAANLPERVEMNGHYGNYTLLAFPAGPMVTITIYGEGESRAALSSEIGWLVQNGKFYTVCDIGAMPAKQEPYCNSDGIWGEETAASVPSPFVPPAPRAPEPATDSGAVEQTMAIAGASAESKAYSPEGAPQQGIGTEQVLQLLGAFLAIIIASYLILHGRTEPALDAVTEKLLDNPTRAGIMNELSGADRIPTDISAKLRKSKAAVVEHLAALSEAGLVERIATPGKKFVFYKLTQKGRRVLLRKAG